jgi:hypothetical protein
MTAEPRLTVDTEGLSIAQGPANQRLQWRDVVRITAYKADLATVDSIRVNFESTDGKSIEIAEEIDGFAELFGALERQFAVSSEWYTEIMFPAFERNEIELWALGDGGLQTDRE